MTWLNKIGASLRSEIELLSLKKFFAFDITRPHIFIFCVLSALMYLFDSFGFAMFLPMLEYVEKGRDLAVLESSSKLWVYLHKIFSAIHLEINLFTLMGAILLLMGLRIVTEYGKQVFAHAMVQRVVHAMRMRQTESYLKADYAFFQDFSTGQTMNTLISETNNAANSIFIQLMLISTFFAIFVYLGVMVVASWQLTLIGLFFIGIASAFVAFGVRSTKKLSRVLTASHGRLAFSMVEQLTAFRLHKLMATETYAIEVIRKASLIACADSFRLKSTNARVDVIYEPIMIICVLLTFGVGLEVIHVGFGLIGLFLLMLFRLLPICKMYLSVRQAVMSVLGSMEIVVKGFENATAHPDIQGGDVIFNDIKKGIRLEGVTYTYPGQARPAVSDVHLQITPGAMTAIVGPSGAGKSTLVDLLSQLRLPQQGEIFFDDIPAIQYKTSALRSRIAFLSQDSFIFNDTIFANIAIGQRNMTRDQVWEVLEKVQMAEHVRALPEQLDTILGERGIRLSGGQKQRLALARILLQNSSIIILDEPTSALDSEIENAIQETLRIIRKEKGVTLIIIAHRFSTIRNADKIVVMKEGAIVQEGTHQELAAAGDWYSRANELQLG